MQRLKAVYLNEVLDEMKKKFNYSNIHQIPKIGKIVINRGLDEVYSQNTKSLDSSVNELGIISGRKVSINYAKKAIAGLEVREGMPIGMSTTLRGDKMYGFLDRLINLSLPRIRDFQGGSSRSFDGYGNYSSGLSEQLMFPEISFDKVNQLQGMNITIVTTCKTDQEGFAFLEALGMPFCLYFLIYLKIFIVEV